MSERDAGRVETIVGIGAEGGSLVMEGQRTPGGEWQFRVSTNESMLWDLLDEEPPAAEAPPWGSWDQAIERLNSYQGWPRLHPYQLHEQFAAAILGIISTHQEGGHRQVARWRKMLARK